MAEIVARGLSKSYGDRPVVSDLSFDVAAGRISGFLGPNGAGKSTTMRLMLGLDQGAGTTLFDGLPYDRLRRPMTRVGVVLDTPTFHPTRTVGAHLGMLAVGGDLPRESVPRVLAAVGLSDHLRARPRAFSLGMRQRLALAAALLGDPDTLILDEPSNGLDPQGVDWLRCFLRGFAATGRSVFLSSHQLVALHDLVDDVVVIAEGRLRWAAPLATFLAEVGQTQVIARCDDPTRLVGALAAHGIAAGVDETGRLRVPGSDTRAVAHIATSAGCLLYELSVLQPSLEQAYLALTSIDRPRAVGSERVA